MRHAHAAVAAGLLVMTMGAAGSGHDGDEILIASQAHPHETYAPENTPGELGIAGWAKVLCSAVFVSGRDPAEAFKDSGYFMLAEKDRPFATFSVDREKKLAHVTLRGTVTRTAKFFGDQGCVILQPGL